MNTPKKHAHHQTVISPDASAVQVHLGIIRSIVTRMGNHNAIAQPGALLSLRQF
jgi:hypothetical protein